MFAFLLEFLRRAHRACQLLLYRAELAWNGRRGNVDGIRLLLPRGVLSTQMAYQLLGGGIDGEDRRLLPRFAEPGDFVLNLGTGCGLSAMAAFRQVMPGGKVVGVEPDVQVHALARRNFDLNDMSAIESLQAAAVDNPEEKSVTFYKKRNYFGSNLLHVGGEGAAVTVPAVYPPHLVPKDCTGRRILLCDVEGYETRLFANREVLDSFDRIIVELHFPSMPKNAVSPYVSMFKSLSDAGFEIVDIDDEAFVFDRPTKTPAGAN